MPFNSKQKKIAYYLSHRDIIIERNKKYYWAHRDEILTKQRKRVISEDEKRIRNFKERERYLTDKEFQEKCKTYARERYRKRILDNQGREVAKRVI